METNEHANQPIYDEADEAEFDTRDYAQREAKAFCSVCAYPWNLCQCSTQSTVSGEDSDEPAAYDEEREFFCQCGRRYDSTGYCPNCAYTHSGHEAENR